MIRNKTLNYGCIFLISQFGPGATIAGLWRGRLIPLHRIDGSISKHGIYCAHVTVLKTFDCQHPKLSLYRSRNSCIARMLVVYIVKMKSCVSMNDLASHVWKSACLLGSLHFAL